MYSLSLSLSLSLSFSLSLSLSLSLSGTQLRYEDLSFQSDKTCFTHLRKRSLK